jgi:bifunctional non-homologous end joining protein LigD
MVRKRWTNLPSQIVRQSDQTTEKMRECHWLNPVLVGQFEFVKWTEDGHLRHRRFVAIREDKKAKDMRRE